MPLREVTAISVLQDPALAASLSVEEWATLQQTADWAHLVEEYSDVIATQLGASVPRWPRSRRQRPIWGLSRPNSSTSARGHRASRVWASLATSAGTPRT